MRRLAVAIAAAMLTAGSVSAGVTPQERAAKVNKDLRKNIAWFFIHPSYNPSCSKSRFLEYLSGRDSEFVDYRNRCNCLRASFIAAVGDLDAPFATCVLMRIRREVKRFSKEDEGALIEKAISSAGFASDNGKSHFHDSLCEEIERASSPAGYTLARMRAIRLEPFILRPPMTLADAVKHLNRKAVAADYVSGGMGVKFDFKHGGFYGDSPGLPKIQVGEYEYGNPGVTLEKAVETIVASVGYAFKIRSDGVVAIVAK